MNHECPFTPIADIPAAEDREDGAAATDPQRTTDASENATYFIIVGIFFKSESSQKAVSSNYLVFQCITIWD